MLDLAFVSPANCSSPNSSQARESIADGHICSPDPVPKARAVGSINAARVNGVEVAGSARMTESSIAVDITEGKKNSLASLACTIVELNPFYHGVIDRDSGLFGGGL